MCGSLDRGLSEGVVGRGPEDCPEEARGSGRRWPEEVAGVGPEEGRKRAGGGPKEGSRRTRGVAGGLA